MLQPAGRVRTDPAQPKQPRPNGLDCIPPCRGSSRSSYTRDFILRAGFLGLPPQEGIPTHRHKHQCREPLNLGLLLQLLTQGAGRAPPAPPLAAEGS